MATVEELETKLNSTYTRINDLIEANKNTTAIANEALSKLAKVEKDFEGFKQAVKGSFSQILIGVTMLSEKTAQSMTLVNTMLMYMAGYDVESAKAHLRKFFGEQEAKYIEAKKLAELRKTAGAEATDANKEQDPVEGYIELCANRLKIMDPHFDGAKFWGLLDLLTVADSMGQEPSTEKLEGGFAQLESLQEAIAKRKVVVEGEYQAPSNVVPLRPKDKE